VLKLADGTLSLLSVPDYAARDGEAVDKLDLRDPAVLVTNGTQAAWLRPGESAPVGSYLVSIADVGLWTTLMVRADKGLPIAYVAFALVIIGMTMRWLVPDGLVAITPAEDGTGYLVWYRDRHGSRAAERAAQAIVAALEHTEVGD
jgi:DNA-binding transcriptional LysR family regulator